MKKILCLSLFLVMVLGLCACGKSGKAETVPKPDQLMVGYGRVDITPEYPVSLAGSASDRLSTDILDPLYMTCIAIKKAEQTYLVVTIDLVGTYEAYANAVRSAMATATGIPEDQIILNATHTHSSVSASSGEKEGIAQYQMQLVEWGAAAATEAVDDLSPAEVWYGSTMAEGMAWVRHYTLNNGTYAGANFGDFNSGAITGHAQDADTEMQLIRFERPAKDKKDVVLMNFPAHATMNGSGTEISADFPGPARKYVAETTNTLVAYFIAAAGNQVPSSRIASENFSSDYNIYGEELGHIAVNALNNMTKLDSSEVKFSQKTFVGQSNKEDMHLLPEALVVESIWAQVGGRGTEAGRKAAKEHGFSSVYEVTAILNRAKFAETRSIELKALAIGDVSMIFAPYEMFGSNGRQIKDASPYGMTFIVTCSHGHAGYLPDKLGVDIRCYEAQITKFTPGTAEILVQEYVNMLTELKGQ